VGAIGSLSNGYDPGYLLRESSKGAEGYYLSAVSEIGEPPGVWTGRACPALGLAAGSEVEPHVMQAMYARLLDPRDPAFADRGVLEEDKARLGKPPRKYRGFDERLAELLEAEPGATPERREALKVQARRMARQAVMFLDFTFSVDKSTSVLHASLQAAAVKAERSGDADGAALLRRQAGIVEGAVRAGAAAAIDYLQDEAGYSRAGYHGSVPRDGHGRPLAGHATGRWVDAHDWVVASFLQHTSRDGDPQLHVHNAILNRAENGDGTWRTLDSRAIYRARAGAAAVGGRVMDEIIARELAAAYEQRPDGRGRELAGVPQAVKDMFSSRRAVISAGVAELAAEYEARHGRAPSARALFSMAQFVTLDTRRAKPRKKHAPTRAEMLDGWAEQMSAAELGALDGIPARVSGTQDLAAPGIEEMAAADVDRVLAAAVADAQAARAAWSRPQLMAAIDAHLPGWLGGLDARLVRHVLEDLTSRALAGGHGVTSLEAPDLVPMPASLLRADGRSVYAPHDRALYATASHLDDEEALARAAAQVAGGPAAGPARVAAALGATPAALAALPGRRPPAATVTDGEEEGPEAREYGGLRADQAAAIWGIMTSGRPVDLLIGPAGAGKSRTVGTIADLWRQLGAGQVTGVATSEAAAQVLAAEAGSARNIARFLAAHARGQAVLRPGDLLIVDEAGMVPTADLAALHAIAAEAGAKMLLTGDPAQLPSVGAGGALAMLARDAGYWQLTQVARMREPWERAASLRLRDGDATVLADYDRHGRLAEGTSEQMTEAAYRGWLGDHLRGRDSLLLAATNEQATSLSARARAELAALGRVEASAPLPLRDGNAAGRGDIIQARRNSRKITDHEGRWIANRDMLRVEDIEADPRTGEALSAVVRRDLGRDPATGTRRWTGPFTVPAGYLRAHAVLGYAGTAHGAQGRTADTTHAVVTPALTRALAYVMLTRGRDANYAYVITDRAAGQPPQGDRALADQPAGQRPAADLRAGTRPAPPLDEPGRDVPEAWREHARATAGDRADASAPWAPQADRLSVLAEVLERDAAEPAARDVRRDEAERAGHMAHLGAIWADLAAEESGRRYDAILARVLSPAQYQHYQAEEARGTLHRQVRAAELAGHHPATLLAAAVAIRPLDDEHRGEARDVSQVLHWRIENEMIGAPAPRTATFAQRTPPSDDPQRAAALLDLAERLDERTADLGARAALRPPRWALDRLGPVPRDPAGRREWASRAGPVAAYREQYGLTDQDRPIGREPAAPEARAAWRAAAGALGRDPADLEVAGASDGELWARRERWERQLAWAPPYVGPALRAAVHARREHETEAAIARARGSDHVAGAHDRLADGLRNRERLLAKADARRARWHADTGQVRDAADAATAELRRRLGTRDPLPYRDPRHRDPERARQAEAAAAARRDLEERRAAEHERRPGQPGQRPEELSFPRPPLARRPAARPQHPDVPYRRPPEPPHHRGPEAGR
jgi:hypothetical protein